MEPVHWQYEVVAEDGMRMRVSGSSPVQVEVCDGRVGRDRSRLAEDGYGEVLTAFQAPRPFDLGERITLPDGSEVVVIGEQFRTERNAFGLLVASQRVSVGDVWPGG